MYEDKKEHLKMIENIITRMANNSFQLKSWTVSLITAILIFVDLKKQVCFIWIIFIPIIVFWVLDAYYLQLERKYRKLYNSVQKDYVNKTNKVSLFDMSTQKFNVDKIIKIMFSKSICPIYFFIIITTLVVLYVSRCVVK